MQEHEVPITADSQGLCCPLTQAGESSGVLQVAAAQGWIFWDIAHQEGWPKCQDRVTLGSGYKGCA